MDTDSQRVAAARFRTTRWSRIRLAGEIGDPFQEEALQNILAQYLPALKEFVIGRFKVDPDRADDLMQSFVLEKILKKELISQADQKRGRFRSFLLNAIYNFVISEQRRADAQKRIPQQALVSVDQGLDGEGIQIIDPETKQQFDRTFMKQVLAEVIDRMRHHCEKIKRPEIWEVFQVRLLNPALAGDKPLDYDKLVQRFGFRSPIHASNILMSGKRMFARVLKSVVGQYSLNNEEFDEEIRYLQNFLKD